MPNSFSITARHVDTLSTSINPATVEVVDGVISRITPADSRAARFFLIPGFVDSHVHIESSMLLPSQFARAAVVHGTVATVSDPHEIANVCGIEGIELMLRDASKTDFKFYLGAPACVPATEFETAGAELGIEPVRRLLEDSRIRYLAEMMDFPGVLAGKHEVVAKLREAQQRNKPIDGHAPGLRGEDVRRYFGAGISTDHECSSIEEAIEKIEHGCKISIREGSAARNFDALWPLINRYADQCMLCSDDKHPDELLLGHINQLVVRAVALGCDPMNVLRAACVNPVHHYGLDVGLLQPGDSADFVLVEDLKSFRVLEVYIGGRRVSDKGLAHFPDAAPEIINRFAAKPITEDDLILPVAGNRIRVIEVIDGQLFTRSSVDRARIVNERLVGDTDRDILKLVVLNRYQSVRPAVAFVHGFGLARGACASTVAHDSHNVIAVGASDAELCRAINAVVSTQGGLSVAIGETVETLPLPVAGLMSTGRCEDVAAVYSHLDTLLKQSGCPLRAPFMTLSFLALLVIPTLKLSDKGLFDVDKRQFVSLHV